MSLELKEFFLQRSEFEERERKKKKLLDMVQLFLWLVLFLKIVFRFGGG